MGGGGGERGWEGPRRMRWDVRGGTRLGGRMGGADYARRIRRPGNVPFC